MDKLRVLAVDDDEVDRMIVQRALIATGLPLELLLEDGVQGALDAIATQDPDCVVLDYQLAGGNAHDVLRALRESGSDVPVIIMTGHGDEELAVELMKSGAFDYLAKSNLRPARLNRSIQAAVQLRRAREERQRARDELRVTAERHRLLAEAGRVLASPRDLDGAIHAFAELAVPTLGEVCIVYLRPDSLQPRVAMATSDPALHDLARRVEATFRPDPEDPRSVMGGAMATARALPVDVIDDELLQAVSHSPEMLEALRAVGARSGLVAPLIAREQTLGAVAFLRTASARAYDADETALGEDLAQRAATAIDNIRLFNAAETARAAAEEANLAKSSFLAAMSHDLRTPLNAIGGYSQLIAEGIHGPVTDEQRAALARIVRAQEHLLTLIGDILGFARIEAGQLELRMEPVPLDETLAGLGAMIEPQRIAQELHYEYRRGGDRIVVHADRERLLQILLNLLTNAVKFTEPGGRITVGWETSSEQVRVYVRDTGRGIPHDMLDAIFEPFVQVRRAAGAPGIRVAREPTRASSVEGVGLGLAISRELARRMGGDLHVTSEPGAGSTFTLVLPHRPALDPDGIAGPRANVIEAV